MSTNTEQRLAPKSQNFLKNNYFKFILNKIPNVEFYVQGCNLPSIGTNYVETKSAFAHPLQTTGVNLDYGTLSLSFIVDEDLYNYMELYNWIKGQVPELTYNDVDSETERYSDASLLILNSVYKPNLRVDFFDLFPVNLGEISFDLTDSDPSPIILQTEFRFKANADGY